MGAGPSIVVLGAGVSGLTTAVRLLEAGARVVVRTAGSPWGTVSAIAGAMVWPVYEEPGDPILEWVQVSDPIFRRLADEPDTGVTIRSGKLLAGPAYGSALPAWASRVPGAVPLAAGELPEGFRSGVRAAIPMVDMPVYLGWLVRRLGELGGRLELRPAASLADAGVEADVVVNCTGIASAELAGDPSVVPVRGQHVVVDCPGLTDYVYEGTANDDWVGVIPHGRRVLLGGVARSGVYDLTPDPAVTEEILRRCRAAVPELADAPVLGVEVGLRPGRPTVRLEVETVGAVRVVHNYGHAGNGVMLSWGCADSAAEFALG